VLLREHLVTEDQLAQALQRQKLFGGRLGSQLVTLGFLDESSLVRALATQMGCEGIVLSKIDIADSIVEMIPATVAVARKVMPFAYDSANNQLLIACEDPFREELLKELEFVALGKGIKPYVAAEMALNMAISQHYLGKSISIEEAEHLVVPHISAEPVGTDGRNLTGAILLVTDDPDSGDKVQSLLEQGTYRVKRTDSADDAIQIIGNQRFHSVLIQDTVPGDYIDLIDRLRKISPKTRVRYYENAAGLLLSLDAGTLEADLLVRNLELFTSLLSSSDGVVNNHSARVGQYVDRLCRRLELGDKDRLIITNAGYLHDLAKFYYGNTAEQDHREYINLTVKLLNSLNYQPLVIEILRSMYINLREKFTKRLPIEVLGGNILTVVDIFCETMRPDMTLTLDKFDTIKRKYRDLIGKLFLTEVVEAFIAMVQEEILSISTLEKYSQVVLLASENDRLNDIEQRIKAGGFRLIVETDPEEFAELYKRSHPDILIIHEASGAIAITTLVEKLIDLGVTVDKVPTFLLTDGALAPQMTGLLEKGIEDVIPADDNLNVLLIKMKKIRARIEAKAREREELVQQSGAVGHLEEMNLIDLIQALGPSRKTARLTVNSTTDKLVLYLSQGAITYAECGTKLGPDAFYEGIAWTNGTWTIQTVTLDQLPPANTFYSNESLLMEGCRLLDESSRLPVQQPS
jgi:response regulator RpfG family c-di-GMP phosphodiesterase